MDQVKVILKLLQKHHFWLLSTVAIVLSLVGWFMARKSLSTTYEANKSKIVGKFGSLQAIQSSENPPNETWKDGIDKITENQKKSVTSAWETVFNEQKSLLDWPQDVLGEDFVKWVNEHPQDAEILVDKRGIYQREIPKEFPKLPKIIDAEPADAKLVAASATKPGKPAVEAHEYKVVWASSSQKQIQDALEWPTQTPTSLEVRQTQEDLWVYRALLKIVAMVNQAKSPSPIREIVQMSIGQDAAAAFEAGKAAGHIQLVKGAAEQSGGGPPAIPPPQGDGGGSPAGAADGRYVTADGNKESSAVAASKQFKRMPIYLRLNIDQREIPKLLVECANSTLPVEVRQLRVNPSKPGSGSSSGGPKPAGPAATAANPNAGLLMQNRGGPSKPAGGASGSTAPGANSSSGSSGAMTESEAYSVPVELLGIIYIYNKPDLSKLGGAGPPVQ
jgi:hypothetical protein